MAQSRMRFCGLLGGLLLLGCNSATGQCAVQNLLKGDFVNFNQRTDVRKPWYVEGKVWILRGNAQSDHTTGWNAIHQSVSLLANKPYALTASVRTSTNMRDGYLGFRGMGLPNPAQMKFGPLPTSKTVRVTFTPVKAGNYDVFIGYKALDKDAAIEMGDLRLVSLSGGCDDVVTKPGQ